MTLCPSKVVVSALILGVLSATAVTRAADAPSWPRFHGPAGNNISSDTGLLKEWPEGGPALIWTAEGIGEGFASVTLSGGLIYTAGNIGEKTVVTALDLSGKIAWQSAAGAAWTASPPGTRGTPTVDGDRVFYENPYGDLFCFHAKTGQGIWKRNILNDFAGKNIQWALSESVIVDGNRLICAPFGQKASVVALDKRSGKTIWAAPPTEGPAGYATATIVESKGLRMILTMSGKALVGINAENGAGLFRYEHLTKYDVNALTPIFIDGSVFISSGYGAGSEMVKLNFRRGKVTAERAWESKEMDNHHGGVALVDGYLYGTSNQGNWVCYDPKNGDVKYSERGTGKGSLTVAEGMLYTLSESDHVVALVKATPEAHQIVSRFTIPDGTKDPSWAHPVVCGGRLYIRYRDRLLAYDVAAK
jgi:outer membrane protein assembly factor BamB